MTTHRGTCKHECKVTFWPQGVRLFRCELKHERCDKARCDMFEREFGGVSGKAKAVLSAIAKGEAK